MRPPQDLLQRSGVQLAAAISNGEYTSVEVVTAHLAQQDRVNPSLNAVVASRRQIALEEAQAVDRGHKAQPFAGVPCSIKECFGLTGMPQTAGLLSRVGKFAQSDATAVSRYRQAGAIPLGVTNTSELCMWMESDNLVYGRTNNPYDLGRTVGGSSGGEAAIIAAGGAPFGLGSDIGGSIRMPCFFNGIFGHKPTGGLVPGTGQHPIADRGALRYLATGPMARKAEDLWPLLLLLRGPDGQDSGCKPWTLGDPAQVEIAKLRVLHIAESGGQPVSADLRAAQANVAQQLADAGAQVEELQLPAMKHGFDIWSSMLAQASETPFATLMGDGVAVNPAVELARIAMGKPRHTLMACLLGMTESLAALAPRRERRFVQMGLALRAELQERLGDDGILLYPSFSMPAPLHRQPLKRQLMLQFDYAYTALLNVMELPVTQVPLGLNGLGLPLGVQVAAGHGQDHLCVAVAQWLERQNGGWVPPQRWLGA